LSSKVIKLLIERQAFSLEHALLEVLQNAMDASPERLLDDGLRTTLDIELGWTEGSIFCVDHGVGMSKNFLTTKYIEIGESVKPPGSLGEFGVGRLQALNYGVIVISSYEGTLFGAWGKNNKRDILNAADFLGFRPPLEEEFRDFTPNPVEKELEFAYSNGNRTSEGTRWNLVLCDASEGDILLAVKDLTDYVRPRFDYRIKIGDEIVEKKDPTHITAPIRGDMERVQGQQVRWVLGSNIDDVGHIAVFKLGVFIQNMQVPYFFSGECDTDLKLSISRDNLDPRDAFDLILHACKIQADLIRLGELHRCPSSQIALMISWGFLSLDDEKLRGVECIEQCGGLVPIDTAFSHTKHIYIEKGDRLRDAYETVLVGQGKFYVSHCSYSLAEEICERRGIALVDIEDYVSTNPDTLAGNWELVPWGALLNPFWYDSSTYWMLAVLAKTYAYMLHKEGTFDRRLVGFCNTEDFGAVTNETQIMLNLRGLKRYKRSFKKSASWSDKNAVFERVKALVLHELCHARLEYLVGGSRLLTHSFRFYKLYHDNSLWALPMLSFPTIAILRSKRWPDWSYYYRKFHQIRDWGVNHFWSEDFLYDRFGRKGDRFEDIPLYKRITNWMSVNWPGKITTLRGTRDAFPKSIARYFVEIYAFCRAMWRENAQIPNFFIELNRAKFCVDTDEVLGKRRLPDTYRNYFNEYLPFPRWIDANRWGGINAKTFRQPSLFARKKGQIASVLSQYETHAKGVRGYPFIVDACFKPELGRNWPLPAPSHDYDQMVEIDRDFYGGNYHLNDE